MNTCVSVRESTIKSLQIIFAYQGQQLIRKIGQKKGWDKQEINAMIKEFINSENLEVKIVSDTHTKRGRKNLDLKSSERCIALTANGDQCSRRRNTSDSNPKYKYYCGIHLRKVKSENGLCYGTVTKSSTNENTDSNSNTHIDTNIDINVDNDSDENSNQSELCVIGNALSNNQNSDNDIEETKFYPLGDNVSDSDSDEITVSSIIINGDKYLINYETSDVFSYENDEYIGKYDNINKTILKETN